MIKSFQRYIRPSKSVILFCLLWRWSCFLGKNLRNFSHIEGCKVTFKSEIFMHEVVRKLILLFLSTKSSFWKNANFFCPLLLSSNYSYQENLLHLRYVTKFLLLWPRCCKLPFFIQKFNFQFWMKIQLFDTF